MRTIYCCCAYAFSWLMVCCLCGCAGERISSTAHRTVSEPPGAAGKAPQRPTSVATTQPNSRETASFELVHQAQQHLLANDPHSAMRALEKALQLNPAGGQNYFFMAEAWIQLKRPHQAIENHRLAERYLPPHAAWQQKLLIQQEKIEALNNAE
jgi:tetratricopeptide (TPR) repeat protein